MRKGFKKLIYELPSTDEVNERESQQPYTHSMEKDIVCIYTCTYSFIFFYLCIL